MTKVSQIFKYIKAEELAIDNTYQRPPSPTLVNRIAKDFQPDKAWPLRVNFRDGRYYVMDGQHRMLGGIKAGVKTLLCQVWIGKSVEEEARFFWETQSRSARRNLTAYQLFNARLASGDDTAIRVKRICESAGIKIVGHLRIGGDCQCVSALESSLYTWGEDALVEALELLLLCWGHDKNGLESWFVQGMTFLVAYVRGRDGSIDRARMEKNLSALRPADIKREAASFPRLMNSVPYRNIAAAFMRAYIGRYKSRVPDRFPSYEEILGITE